MKRRERSPDWPEQADTLALATLSRLTAISVPDLSRYRSGDKRMSPETRERIDVASRVAPDSHLATRHTVITYPRLALTIKDNLDDPRWCVRILAHVAHQCETLQDEQDLRAAHIRPPKTGSREWDALIAATAEITWQRNFPDEPPPAWIRETGRVAPWWSPLDYSTHWAWAFLRTPINFRDRGIVFQRGELETV